MPEVTIYHLEMHTPDALKGKPKPENLQVIEAKVKEFRFNRFLYQLVGGAWSWTDKLVWSDEQWCAYAENDDLRTWVAYSQGSIAGYYELQKQDQGNVYLAYFGLAPQFLDKGFGGYLLTHAIQSAWAFEGAKRVHVQTCTLDHPAALNNYKARGFKLFKTGAWQAEASSGVAQQAAGPESRATGLESVEQHVLIGDSTLSLKQSVNQFNQPLSGNDMPRFSGPGTMMRLPSQPTAAGLDACFVGVGLDIGLSNRAGARFGPRQIRAESSMIRPYSMRLGFSPFDRVQVADIGDVPLNTYNLLKSVAIIEHFYDEIVAQGAAPFTLGGDHTIVLPIMRALAKKYGPVGVVHIDAHADINDSMFGEKIAHGTPFRRMVEEKLIQPDKVVQIGLRTTGYHADDFDWSRQQGMRVVEAEDCWYRSLAPLMAEVREQMGNHPVYISFDIDGLDPAYAPGTGTAEPGGLTSQQGFEIVRGCHGMNIMGGDLVEVSPPYDPSGNTAVLGANLLYEMLCAFAAERR